MSEEEASAATNEFTNYGMKTNQEGPQPDHVDDIRIPSTPPESPPAITRSDTDEIVSIKRNELADELEAEIQARKEQLNLELEEERRLKIEERRALAYRLKHGIESDSENDHEDDSHEDDYEEDFVQDDDFAVPDARTGIVNLESINLSSAHTASARDSQSNNSQINNFGDNDNGNIEEEGTDDDLISEGTNDDMLSVEGDGKSVNGVDSFGNKSDSSVMDESGTKSDLFDANCANEIPQLERDIDESVVDVSDSAIIDVKEGADEGTVEDEDDVKDTDDIISGECEGNDVADEEIETVDEVTASDAEAEEEDEIGNTGPEAPIYDETVSEMKSNIPKPDQSGMIDDSETDFYQHLKIGFEFIRHEMKARTPKRKKKGNAVTVTSEDLHGLPPSFVQSLQQMPLVNFIDPTSAYVSGVNSSSSTEEEKNSPSRHMKRKAWNREVPKQKLRELRIFEKFDTVFREYHQSTLPSVAYKNARTNEIEKIEYLPLRTKLTAPVISDPEEWHNSPICHVYIAACCSVDHYRAKVRPALRAFVNQIDGAGSGNQEKATSAAKEAARKEYGAKKRVENKREQVAAANKAVAAAKDAAGGNASSKYLIIFVPINASSVDAEMPTPAEEAYKSGGLGLRGRFAAAAARRNHPQSPHKAPPKMERSSTDDSAEDGSSSQILMLSKEHKEVHKKFISDFPKGRTCVLSTLLDSDNNLAPESPIQKQDFHIILQEMGKTVLGGFVDRIHHYNEELKRCENERARLGIPDWKRYFLIKESAALTFEQMKLPHEALTEYEDLELKLPKGSILDVEKDFCPATIRAISSSGNIESFRKIVRSVESITDVEHLMSMYLFARQSHLLFLQELPTQVVMKCLSHVKKVHRMRCDQASSLGPDESKIALLRNEIWALSACWDLKCAADVFCREAIESSSLAKFTFPRFSSKEFVSSISDVLIYARMRLVKISEMVFAPDTLIRKAMDEFPSDALQAWAPWSNLRDTSDEQQTRPQIQPGLVPINNDVDQSHFPRKIIQCLKSDDQIENIYIEVCESIVAINTHLKRKRCVSRILADLAEIYILRGDINAAEKNLLLTFYNYSLDPWDSLLTWRVFRLACCQRKLSDAPQYLKTLTYCLGTRLAKTIPTKLRHLMQQDLEAIVCGEEVADFRWTLSPLFGLELKVKQTAGGEFEQPLLTSDVLMHTCEIGDKVQADVLLKSNLADAIEIDSLDIFLLKIDDYKRMAEVNEEVTVSDAAFVLTTNGSLKLEPGNNTLSFPWPAMSVGQYVIACVCMKWRKAEFYQDFTTLSKGIVGFDVLPNEPTQSIELNPIFLIPGHIQNVRLLFHSGSDVVNGGKVKFCCSQGLQVMPVEDDQVSDHGEWKDSCEFDLGSCLPNSTTTLIASVKSDAIESYDPNASGQNEGRYSYAALQTLDARVTTSYHHGLYTSHVTEDRPIGSPPITAILEASVTTLELAALTIKKSGAFPIGGDKFVISATVFCNTPVAFSLKKWELSLFSSSLALDDDGDLNGGLFERSVIEGEELHFGFRCKRSDHPVDKVDANQTFLNIVLQDEFGKSFRQVLPLDIRSIYRFLRDQDDAGNNSLAKAELRADALEGLVGAPVMFTYDLDYSSLEIDVSSSRILYHVSCVEADWIVGGPVRGTLENCSESMCSLSFVGIPIKAGKIKNFPRIELALLRASNDSENSSSSIKMQQKYPSAFLSLAHKTADAMACTSTIAEI